MRGDWSGNGAGVEERPPRREEEDRRGLRVWVGKVWKVKKALFRVRVLWDVEAGQWVCSLLLAIAGVESGP